MPNCYDWVTILHIIIIFNVPTITHLEMLKMASQSLILNQKTNLIPRTLGDTHGFYQHVISTRFFSFTHPLTITRILTSRTSHHLITSQILTIHTLLLSGLVDLHVRMLLPACSLSSCCTLPWTQVHQSIHVLLHTLQKGKDQWAKCDYLQSVSELLTYLLVCCSVDPLPVK